MKNQFLLGAIATSALSVGTIALGTGSAQAVSLVACDASLVGVGQATSCQYVTDPLTGNANASDNEGDPNGAINVNDLDGDLTPLEDENDVFFFDSDAGLWDYLGNAEGFSDSGDQSDSYSLSGFDEYMAVFKDGRNATLMSFLLTSDSGTLEFDAQLWDSFLDTNPGAVSNIRYFGRTNEPRDVVPTPAAVLPILGGLFGAASRRKKGESTEA